MKWASQHDVISVSLTYITSSGEGRRGAAFGRAGTRFPSWIFNLVEGLEHCEVGRWLLFVGRYFYHRIKLLLYGLLTRPEFRQTLLSKYLSSDKPCHLSSDMTRVPTGLYPSSDILYPSSDNTVPQFRHTWPEFRQELTWVPTLDHISSDHVITAEGGSPW